MNDLAKSLDRRQKALKPCQVQQVRALWQVHLRCAEIRQNARGVPTKVPTRTITPNLTGPLLALYISSLGLRSFGEANISGRFLHVEKPSIENCAR